MNYFICISTRKQSPFTSWQADKFWSQGEELKIDRWNHGQKEGVYAVHTLKGLLNFWLTYGSGTSTEYVRIWDLGIVTAGSLQNLLILWPSVLFPLESGKTDLEKQESLILVQRG